MKSTFGYQTFVINVFKYTMESTMEHIMEYTVVYSSAHGTIEEKIYELRKTVNTILSQRRGKVKGGITFVNDKDELYACQTVLMYQPTEGGRKYTRKSKRK